MSDTTRVREHSLNFITHPSYCYVLYLPWKKRGPSPSKKNTTTTATDDSQLRLLDSTCVIFGPAILCHLLFVVGQSFLGHGSVSVC